MFFTHIFFKKAVISKFIETMPPSKNLKKLDIFVRGHLVVALLLFIHGAGAILNGK